MSLELKSNGHPVKYRSMQNRNRKVNLFASQAKLSNFQNDFETDTRSSPTTKNCQKWWKHQLEICFNELCYNELGYNDLSYNKLGYNNLSYNELNYNELQYNEFGYTKFDYNELIELGCNQLDYNVLGYIRLG